MHSDIRVLIVEDDQDLCESVVEYLGMSGLQAESVKSAAEFYQAVASRSWHVVVVDIGLPDQTGYVLVEYLRSNTDMKVIILTARDAVEDRVRGYDAGADLYLVKPVDLRELAAAIISLANRQVSRNEQQPFAAFMAVPDTWTLTRKAWALVTPASLEIPLTGKELQFLELLATCPGKPVSREAILTKLYQRYDEHTSRALDSLVRRLRAKIMTSIGAPVPIKTLHSVGYCFSVPLRII